MYGPTTTKQLEGVRPCRPAAAAGDDSQSVDSAGRKKKEPDWFAGKLVGSELGRAEIKRGLRSDTTQGGREAGRQWRGESMSAVRRLC